QRNLNNVILIQCKSKIQIFPFSTIFTLSLRSVKHMKTILSIFFLSIANAAVSQTGGLYSFPMLNLVYSARSAGLSGDLITAKDQDINLGVSNPSLYNGKMHNELSLSQAFKAGGINYGMFSYGHSLKKNRFIAGHIRYVSYNKMERTEANGVHSGTFN